jgi:hypothetical protein
MKKQSRRWRVFGAPAAIGALTMAGLAIGLSLGAAGQNLSSALVGSPVAVVVWVWLRVRLRRLGAATSPARYRRG